MINNMDMEKKLGQMVQILKDNTNSVRKMEKVNLGGKIAQYMRVNLRIIIYMVKTLFLKNRSRHLYMVR